MQKFFTADYHFGHENIIKYCQRPFKNVEHMNNEIIKRHNQRVKPEDMVFFLGDFCFRNSKGGKHGEGEQHKAEYYLNKLNGMFIPIRGNHDRNNSLKTIVEKVIIEYSHHRVCLVHNPAYANNNFKFNFVGHVHNAWRFKKEGNKNFLCNVGVDVWDFHPVKFEEIMKRLFAWNRQTRFPNGADQEKS